MADLEDTDPGEVYGEVTTGASEGEQSGVCETCLGENNNRPAVGWCETCDELLCDVCFKTHCRPKRMRAHQLCSITDMNIRKQRKKVANRCEEHGEQLLKYFCEDHSELGCSQCFVTKHRPCNKVVCIAEVETSESEEFKALVNQLSELDERLKAKEETADRNAALTARQHDKAIAAIEEAGEKLKTLIDKLVKNQIAKSQKIKADNLRNLANAKETIEVVALKLQSCREMLAAEKEDNNQLFLATKHLQHEVELLKSKLQESEKVSEYEFVLNQELASALEKVTELGTLTDKHILNMEKATDEVAEEMEIEVKRFERTSSRGNWFNQKENPDVICVTTDHDIRLLDVLLFPCLTGDTKVELIVLDDRRTLIKCSSTHKYTSRDVLAVKVVNKARGFGMTLHAGHQYRIIVNIKGSPSHYGIGGQATVTVAGVRFSFTESMVTQRLMTSHILTQWIGLMNTETTVSEGQIAGFRFTRV